ncbi:putative transporter [Campylobacter sp. FMV-PI01]|uniref:Putative transporter n=1 Tax=Campylobacter portucalensis TaxID=2608384 RepID=A0A6L5WHK6_9BACT|nr:putative transporter [Campylobacter portucalensis]MSN95912.1 putative transporter [Campylobacter portucalensis]
MFRSFFLDKKLALWAYGGLAFILLSLVFQTQINVAINNWYKDFYDIMQNVQKHTLDEFWSQIFRFLYLAMPYVIIHTITTFFTSHWSLKWREAMTFSYLNQWKKCEKDIEGSSQRMQEDIYNFAKIMQNLGLNVVKAFMTLVAFIPILWGLSDKMPLPYLRNIPGNLVWLALIISIGGLIISWFVGIKLPGLEYNNQKAEAAFRKELVYAEDDKNNYANYSVMLNLFTGLKVNYHRLFLHYGYFNIWLISFSQFMVIVPYLIMGSGLFIGIVTLGILVQVSNAFSQVRTSFSVFINNWTTITELRSIHKRLREFEENIGYKEL